MLLGKRARPEMKRTTSMKEFTLDLNNNLTDLQQPSDPLQLVDQRLPNSPSNNRRNSADFIETAPFLKSCFLCKRGLIPGRDIYIYRGESAFCSLECRQRQISQDERREKCTMKKTRGVSGRLSVSGKGDTAAAAV